MLQLVQETSNLRDRQSLATSSKALEMELQIRQPKTQLRRCTKSAGTFGTFTFAELVRFYDVFGVCGRGHC